MSVGMNDGVLLQEFVRKKSEAAFQELVRRHGPLVYSCARQRVGDPHAAEDIAQSVFLALAIKAASLPADVSLPGWLYRATRFASAKYQRSEQNRREREMKAHQHQQLHETALDTAALWQEISPHLMEALDDLSAPDREAVLLRFYERADYNRIAAALRVSTDAARKRVDRALAQLRQLLDRKGVGIGAGALATVLGAHAAEAMPAAVMAQSVKTAVAVTIGTTASSTSTLMLAKGALLTMTLSKIKGMIAVAAVCLLAVGTALVIQRNQSDRTHAPDLTAESTGTAPTVEPGMPPPAVVEPPIGPTTTTPATVVAMANAFVLRLKITDVAKTDTGYVAIGQVLRVVQSPDPEVQGSGFEVWLGMPLSVTPPVKASECTFTLVRRNSGGNVWDCRFPNDNPTGHVTDCLLPGDTRPPVIRNDYLSQQTAQLFWNSVVEGRLDQAMAVIDTPFAWGIDPVVGRDDLRKRLESPEFKTAFAGMRWEQMEIVLVPDNELSNVLQQKFNLTDTDRIAVVAWVMDGKARILVAVRAGDRFKVVGIGD
jgi:RNA polymerase sigma factor (sigma-70 family)